jgi:hypothetical protein
VSDIFQEVEEEVRRERYEQLWKEYGDYIIAAAAFVVIAAAGWQLWRYYEQRQQLEASAQYTVALQLLNSGQTPAAAESFGKIASDGPSGYAKIARMQEAGALLASGRTDDGLKIYREVASSSDAVLADVARIRIAWATIDTSTRAQIEQQLASMTDVNNPWNPMAREVLAYSDFRDGDIAKAQTEYKNLAGDKNAPQALHQRAAAMATFLAAGGGRDYGTLPHPSPAPASPSQGTKSK